MRNVINEARMYRFLLWYHENSDLVGKAKDFVESIIEQANSGKTLTEKQISACEKIARVSDERHEYYSMLEGHAFDIY